MSLNTDYGLEGRFRCVVRKASTGEVTKDTGFFKNIITDYGLNAIGGTASVLQGCTVGSGTTPESASDTVIQNYVARTNTIAPGGSATNSNTSTAEPYFARCTISWRFAEGAAAGNLTEVGVIALYTAPNYFLWSRTLIKDTSGNPITITVLADEILDVYYEARIYLQSLATTGTLSIAGSSYDYRILNGSLQSPLHAFVFTRGFSGRAGYVCGPYTGPLSAAPNYAGTGTGLAASTVLGVVPYSPGSFTASTVYTFPPGVATGSMRSFIMSSANTGPIYSMEITPAYNKIATVEVKVTHSVTWSRRSI